ncbi:hypothetical protein VFPPC_10289 [Pochonia chlamydosporia 170]|uniref:Uncharacterized protein n=1 Tax=Pochonia chlamydosporia 170 TaxID=1380566 RepID=A0A179F1H1_METCM|nr:hypothetical protein VFPPC_10289 [Pochonia chlamydosporia 170]OAQ59268.1 hypothetical protein VFPPC_10289 [Pochonia chlamydosporia 170]
MVSSTFPHEGADFQTIETAQGSVVVSTDLLTTSNAAADENFNILLKPNTDVVGKTSSSSTSSPSVAEDEIESPNIASMPLQYPEASNITVDNPSTYKIPEVWPVDPDLHELDSFDYEQPRGEAGIPADQPFAQPSEIAPLPLNTAGPVNPSDTAPATIPPGPVIPSLVLNGNSLDSEPPSQPASTEPIPSYMTPEAIRARNLILSCNLPRRTGKITGRARSPERHVSFSDDPKPSKRQKLDSNCCNR